MSVTGDRIERIAAHLRSLGAEVLVTASPSRVLMITGYWPIIGTAIVCVSSSGETYLIAPADESGLAHAATVDHLTLATPGSLECPTTLVEDIKPYLKTALHTLGVGSKARIAVDSGAGSEPASYVAMTAYGSDLPVLVRDLIPAVTLLDPSAMLVEESAVLAQAEIELVRRAASIAREAYERGITNIRAGVTEVDASIAMEGLLSTCSIAKYGADRAFGHVACMSGKNSGVAYGAFARSTRKTIAINDLILTHCNSTVSGYWTDVTRTYFLGDPSKRVLSMYTSLLKASRAGIARVKVGVRAEDVDSAVRESLKDDGFGEQFKHGTGHGVGFAAIDHRARPRLRPNSPDVLRAGMIFNIEPGIYFEDFGGMRHCDMVLCTESGAELLTPFHSTIEELLLV